MDSFGMLLKEARVRLGMTQQELTNAVNQRLAAASIVQTWIAKLETGKVKWPDKDLLLVMADILGLTYNSVVAALMKDRYGQGNLDYFYPLEKGVLTLTELALWEASESHVETWVAVREFTDEYRGEFREAVLAILDHEHRITFFMAAGLEERFELYREHLSANLGRQVDTSELRYVPLSTAQRAFLVSPFVLASKVGLLNRSDSEPEGFQFLTDEQGEPRVAIRLSTFEARERHIAMSVLANQLKLAA